MTLSVFLSAGAWQVMAPVASPLADAGAHRANAILEDEAAEPAMGVAPVIVNA